jgi:hypothetical protein
MDIRPFYQAGARTYIRPNDNEANLDDLDMHVFYQRISRIEYNVDVDSG